MTTLENDRINGALPPGFGAAIFRHAAAGIVISDRDGSILHANPALARMSGYSVTELTEMTVAELTHPEDQAVDRGLAAEVVRGERPEYQAEKRYIHRTGRIIWGRLIVSPVKRDEGTTYLLAVVEDITDRKETQEALERERAHFERLFASIPEGVALVDEHDTVLRINPEFTRLFGYMPGEAVGRRLGELIVPEGRDEEALAVTRRVVAGERVRRDVTRCHKNGAEVDVGVVGAPIQLGGDHVAVYAIYRDIRERKSLERALRRASITDELTGALNRRGFLQIAEREWRLARRRDSSLLLLYGDLDGFKKINDRYGHAAGDRLLREVATRIQASLRTTDLVARLGGDEFVVLAVDADDADAVTERIEAAVRRFNEGHDHPYRLSMSIGAISIPARSAPSLEELLAEADRRMYEAKRRRGAAERR